MTRDQTYAFESMGKFERRKTLCRHYAVRAICCWNLSDKSLSVEFAVMLERLNRLRWSEGSQVLVGRGYIGDENVPM